MRKDITKEVKSEQRRLSWIYECEQTEEGHFKQGEYYLQWQEGLQNNDFFKAVWYQEALLRYLSA